MGESRGHTKNVPINTKMMIKREQILLIFRNFGTHWSNFGIDTDCNQLFNGINNGLNNGNTLEEIKSSISKWKKKRKSKQTHWVQSEDRVSCDSPIYFSPGAGRERFFSMSFYQQSHLEVPCGQDFLRGKRSQCDTHSYTVTM